MSAVIDKMRQNVINMNYCLKYGHLYYTQYNVFINDKKLKILENQLIFCQKLVGISIIKKEQVVQACSKIRYKCMSL